MRSSISSPKSKTFAGWMVISLIFYLSLYDSDRISYR